MTVLLKATGIAIICLFTLLCLKNMREDFSPIVKITATVLFFGVVAAECTPIIEFARDAFLSSGMEDYEAVMLKALAIAFITQFASAICRDSGENGIAMGIEQVGRAELVILSLPLLTELISLAREMIEW